LDRDTTMLDSSGSVAPGQVQHLGACHGSARSVCVCLGLMALTDLPHALR